MKGLPLISVIIPVYNSEDYLDRCLNSVCGQTFGNLEVILVNDGSSDRSGEICREYEQKDSRIRFINQQNRGSAEARNTGLRLARGELIGFVDSDDHIRPEMYEKLYRIMTDTEADIALCDVESGGKSEHPDWLDGTFRGKGAIFSEFIHGRVINRVYNKLYRVSVIQGVDFPVGRNMMEDASWTPRVLERADCITRLAEPMYIYTDNKAGLTRSKFSHTKVCSRFANLLDRESVCLRNAVDEKDKLVVAGELIRYIRQMMESTDSMDLFDINRTLKETVEEHREILEKVASMDEKIMLESIRQCELPAARKQYWRAILIHGRSIKDRIRLIRQRIGR